MITTEKIHKICFLIFLTHLHSIFRTTHSILEWFVHQKTSNCLEELNAVVGLTIWDRVGIDMVNNATIGICTKNSRFRDIHNTAKITPIWSDLEWAQYTTYRYHERWEWIESSCSVASEHAFWPPPWKNDPNPPHNSTTDHFSGRSLQIGVILEWIFRNFEISQNSTLSLTPYFKFIRAW